jgi:hypothetical protein
VKEGISHVSRVAVRAFRTVLTIAVAVATLFPGPSVARAAEPGAYGNNSIWGSRPVPAGNRISGRNLTWGNTVVPAGHHAAGRRPQAFGRNLTWGDTLVPIGGYTLGSAPIPAHTRARVNTGLFGQSHTRSRGGCCEDCTWGDTLLFGESYLGSDVSGH